LSVTEKETSATPQAKWLWKEFSYSQKLNKKNSAFIW